MYDLLLFLLHDQPDAAVWYMNRRFAGVWCFIATGLNVVPTHSPCIMCSISMFTWHYFRCFVCMCIPDVTSRAKFCNANATDITFWACCVYICALCVCLCPWHYFQGSVCMCSSLTLLPVMCCNVISLTPRPELCNVHNSEVTCTSRDLCVYVYVLCVCLCLLGLCVVMFMPLRLWPGWNVCFA